MTDSWDPSIPEHKAIAHGIEVGDGIPEMRTAVDARKALLSVGFDVLHEEDLAARPDPVPWYYPLEGDITKAQTAWDYFTVWRMSAMGILFTHTILWFMQLVGLVPKGTWEVGETLRQAADALVKGGQQKVYIFPFYEISQPNHNLSAGVHTDASLRRSQARRNLVMISFILALSITSVPYFLRRRLWLLAFSYILSL